jgi:hypothetical protein
MWKSKDVLVNLDSVQWQFAFQAALASLRHLVWEFNFEEELSGHARYVGIHPDHLASVIDGFLDIREHIGGGTVTNLMETYIYLRRNVLPTYLLGEMVAQKRWASASTPEAKSRLAEASADQVMAEAWKLVPPDYSSNLANWFVEGFCYAEAMECFEYMKETVAADEDAESLDLGRVDPAEE